MPLRPLIQEEVVTFLDKQISPWPVMVLAIVVLAISAQLAAAQEGSLRLASVPSDVGKPHPLDPALKMARDSLRHLQEEIDDYTAVMVKRLRIGGELKDYEYTFVKIRNRKKKNDHVTTPMAVYLKFIAPGSVKGREVIWVEGSNDGKLIAHETGYKNLFRVKLDPSGFIAMRRQRHPISDIGMENLVKKIVETGERDRRHGECEVEFFENAKVGENVCTVMQVVHPVKRPYFDFYRARIFFDDDLNVPVRYAAWSWPAEEGGPPVLKEEYTYTDIKLNVGLTESDFDPDNAEYNFP